MENVTNDRFGMCPICNKAKWSHTNDQEIYCTQIMLNDLKNKISELKIVAKISGCKVLGITETMFNPMIYTYIAIGLGIVISLFLYITMKKNNYCKKVKSFTLKTTA